MYRQPTIYRPGAIDPDLATGLYECLREGIDWEEGIRSRTGFTRKAKAINLEDYPDLQSFVVQVIRSIVQKDYILYGAYLNYYENGEMYTPNHSHKGTQQLIISLGATRELCLGKKSYAMHNGDAIIFGSTVHGVTKDPNITEGRISIAVFMKAL